MAKPNKNKELSETIDFLRLIFDASRENGLGYAFAPADIAIKHSEAGYVFVDPNIVNELNEIAVKINNNGLEFIGESPDIYETEPELSDEIDIEAVEMELQLNSTPEITPNPSKETAMSVKGFNLVLLESIPPVRTRQTLAADAYPFEAMEVGHSFFIPNSNGEDIKIFKGRCANIAQKGKNKFAEVSIETGKKVFIKHFSSKHIENGAAYGFEGQSGCIIVRTA